MTQALQEYLGYPARKESKPAEVLAKGKVDIKCVVKEDSYKYYMTSCKNENSNSMHNSSSFYVCIHINQICLFPSLSYLIKHKIY